MKAIKLLHRVTLPTENPASIAYHPDGIQVADVERGDILLVDYKTGECMSRFSSIVPRPQTISWDGEFLWEYDEETSDLYKHSLTGKGVFHFGQVEGVNTPYYGFAYHDTSLWLLTPDQPEFTVANNHISVIDFPRNIQSEDFEAPTHSCRGLYHDGRYLWTLDVEQSEVFALDPRRGIIITSYELDACDSPSSIIVTEDRIWTLNLRSNELLTYSLDRDVIFSTSGGRHSDVELVYTIRNSGPGTIEEYELFNSLPDNYLHQHILSPSHIVPEATEMLTSQWAEGDGQVVSHRLKNLLPNQEQEVAISFKLETANLKFHIYPHKTGLLDDIPPHISKNYLFQNLKKSPDPELREVVRRAQLLFQTGEREIMEKVEEIVGGEKNPFWIARLLYNYVVSHIKYVLPYTSISARKILSQGKGSCGNHATIYIALCQEAGLPARSIVGFSLWKNDSRLGYLDHEIPEVYLPSYGWIPADTSRFMSLPIYGTHPLTKFRSFATLSDRFFINGFGRDLHSPFARRRHREERLCRVNGPCEPDIRFFMRWKALPSKTWLEWEAPSEVD